MNTGQALLFIVVGGGVALVVAAVIAALVSRSVGKSTKRQLDSQLKAQKDLNDEQVRALRGTLQEGQQQSTNLLVEIGRAHV